MTPAEPHMTTAEVQPGMTDEAQPEMTDDVDPTMTHDAEPAITPRRDDEPSWRARQRYADPPEVLERPESSTLTSREREVAALIASGYDTRAIAHELAISEATVRTLTRRVLSKLGVTASRLAGKESGGPRDDTEAG
jgi:DNA-binding NarL/FixJ family response regulator